jgi:hypothetical protein
LQPPAHSLTLVVKGCFDFVENAKAIICEDADAGAIMGSKGSESLIFDQRGRSKGSESLILNKAPKSQKSTDKQTKQVHKVTQLMVQG